MDDPVCAYFPEMLPGSGPHPFIAATTIRDLLMMAAPHKDGSEIYKGKDWVSPFFTVVPTHVPGTVFSYFTVGTNLLATLVEKLSGQPFLDYMRARGLNQLGFSPDAYCMPGKGGVPWGGSGINATPMDLAKVAWAATNGGRYKGHQVLPGWYLKEATAKQIDTWGTGHNEDRSQGYGYQIWRMSNNSFAFVGLGLQLALCLPDKNLVFVTTGNDMWHGNPMTIQNAFWDCIYPHVGDRPLPPDNAAAEKLNRRLHSLAIPVVSGAFQAAGIQDLHDRTVRLQDNPLYISQVKFVFDDAGGVFHFEKNGQWHRLTFGYGKHIRQPFAEYGDDAIASGAWANDDTLNICCLLPGNRNAAIRITARVRSNAVTIGMSAVAEGMLEDYDGHASGYFGDAAPFG